MMKMDDYNATCLCPEEVAAFYRSCHSHMVVVLRSGIVLNLNYTGLNRDGESLRDGDYARLEILVGNTPPQQKEVK